MRRGIGCCTVRDAGDAVALIDGGRGKPGGRIGGGDVPELTGGEGGSEGCDGEGKLIGRVEMPGGEG